MNDRGRTREQSGSIREPSAVRGAIDQGKLPSPKAIREEGVYAGDACESIDTDQNFADDNSWTAEDEAVLNALATLSTDSELAHDGEVTVEGVRQRPPLQRVTTPTSPAAPARPTIGHFRRIRAQASMAGALSQPSEHATSDINHWPTNEADGGCSVTEADAIAELKAAFPGAQVIDDREAASRADDVT